MKKVIKEMIVIRNTDVKGLCYRFCPNKYCKKDLRKVVDCQLQHKENIDIEIIQFEIPKFEIPKINKTKKRNGFAEDVSESGQEE